MEHTLSSIATILNLRGSREEAGLKWAYAMVVAPWTGVTVKSEEQGTVQDN